MNKEELLKNLDNAIAAEEDGTIIYAKHLKTVLLWSGLADNTKNKINLHINKILEDNKKHEELFKKIKCIILEN